MISKRAPLNFDPSTNERERDFQKRNFSYRWVKFEEDVEDGGQRWSKPHVGTLSLHSLFELRNLLTKGTILLDMEASSLDDIADLMLDQCVNGNVLPNDLRVFVKDAIMKKKRHLFEKSTSNKEKSLIRSLTDYSNLASSSSKRKDFSSSV